MDKYTEITELLLKHLRQELTPGETATLMNWVEESDRNRQFFSDINNTSRLMADVRAYGEGKKLDEDAAWAKIRALAMPVEPKVVRLKMWRYAVAVAAVLMVAVGIYLLQPREQPAAVPTVVQAAPPDAKPITHNAYLTLDNGETIVLDSLQSGLLATQGNTKVTKYSDGIIRYLGGKAAGQKIIYNKVTVPKGSDVVYLQLSDGSKVWLNAASTIRYPVDFIDDERRVEITGEAYFEITKAPKKKFIVSKGNMHVTVLGTRFNVNAYDNEENIKVTLLEGSIRVVVSGAGKSQLASANSAEQAVTLKPGQQAVLAGNSPLTIDHSPDLEQVMAWKEGKFVFNNTNIQLIMRQMERWYDLEPTKFENNEVKQWEFNGEISRYSNASKILQLLEKTGSVKFSVEGKKIVVKQP